MLLKLHLLNGKNVWVDKAEAKTLQGAGKVWCILQEYDDSALSQIRKQPPVKQPLQWL